MTDQPSRVTPAEISALLDQARGLTRDSPLAEQIAYHERKAALLSRIAASLDTAEAHAVAADAWHHVGDLARQRDDGSRGERGHEDVRVLRPAAGPDRQPRPVRPAGLALARLSHPRLGDHHRPAGPGRSSPWSSSWPGTRCWTWCSPSWPWPGGWPDGPARSS